MSINIERAVGSISREKLKKSTWKLKKLKFEITISLFHMKRHNEMPKEPRERTTKSDLEKIFKKPQLA